MNKTLTLSITKKCNLQCEFCAAKSNNDEKHFIYKEIKKIILEAYKNNFSHIIISGGEPFFHPDIFKILLYIEEFGMNCTILTNGTLIDESLVGKIKNLDCLNSIRFSIDYSDSKKLAEARGRKDILNIITENIDLTVKNNIRCGINMTLFEDNLDDIFNIASIGKTHNMDYFRAAPYVSNSDLQVVTNDFYYQCLSKILKVASVFQKDVNYPNLLNKYEMSEYSKNKLFSNFGCGSTLLNYNGVEYTICPFCKKEEHSTEHCTVLNNSKIDINNIWMRVFNDNKSDNEAINAINGIVFRHEYITKKKSPICFRSLPIWWFPYKL